MAIPSKCQRAQLRDKWHAAFARLEVKAAILSHAFKAGFDPNQPRVPAGNPDGGQWTSGSSGGGDGSRRTASSRDEGRILSDATPDDLTKPGTRLAQARGKDPKKDKPGPKLYPAKKKRPSPVKKLDVPLDPKTGASDRPLEPPPDIPPKKPRGKETPTKSAKRITHWLQKARGRAGTRTRIGAILTIIETVSWLIKAIPDMQSYFDEPKSLKDLQDAVLDPLEGYEIHHIVPQKSPGLSAKDKLRLNTAENLVRISTWKHHEISVWFRQLNEDFVKDGEEISPQEFLEDKDWDKRMEVGLDALRVHGVLKDEDD